jgi:hypothetical protein
MAARRAPAKPGYVDPASASSVAASAAFQLPWRRMITGAPGRRCPRRQVSDGRVVAVPTRVGAQRVAELLVADGGSGGLVAEAGERGAQ